MEIDVTPRDFSVVPDQVASTHPLDRLTAAEIAENRSILEAAGLILPGTRFMLVSLEEPTKQQVAAWARGELQDRAVRSVLMDRATGKVDEIVVSLTRAGVVSERTVDVVQEGQPPILGEEFDLVESILWKNDDWRVAMERRGLVTPERVRISALSAGCFDIEGEVGRRLVRCLAFLQLDAVDNVFAHPIDGVVAYVDLITSEVIDVIDDELFDISLDTANFHLPHPAPRTSQKPIEITQPQGASFSVDGNVVEWENWRFRIGFNQVEGLTLHELSYADQGRRRPIIYRASVAEMVVPYGDPSPVRFWQNYFDAGEYSMGKAANSLALGCDCLGEICYFDAHIGDADGRPQTVGNAICLHEEDAGILWKHTDMYNGAGSTRRQRRLVISFFITVGNYDYGFYWYLYLDGTIELECKATGVVFTSSYPGARPDGSEYPWASEVAPGIGAPYHQHLFSARLDMMVDGATNAVDEVQAQRVMTGPDNPYGNGFTRRRTRLQRETDGVRMADPTSGRFWQVSNPGVTNIMGQAVSYALYPEGQPVLLADDTSSIARRAAFTTKHLWVTANDRDERFPAGEYVNQNPGNTGIDTWIAADRNINGADIVLWHTFGLTHFPRPEDWPIMPVDSTGFVLKPFGFFDRNPALDTPDPTAASSAGNADSSCCWSH